MLIVVSSRHTNFLTMNTIIWVINKQKTLVTKNYAKKTNEASSKSGSTETPMLKYPPLAVTLTGLWPSANTLFNIYINFTFTITVW